MAASSGDNLYYPVTQKQYWLEWLIAGLPFKVGDKVSCTSAGVIYDGIGHIVEISTDPKDLASPVIPMFRVEMDEKAYPEMPDEMWYPEILLKKVEADA